MRRLLFIIVCDFLLCLLGVQDVWGQTHKMLSPGRTWWYSSRYFHTDKYLTYEDMVIGLQLADAADEDGWIACYAIDANQQKIKDVHLAYLKEEDNKVWIKPNLSLVVDYTAYENNFSLEILDDFLGYADGYHIKSHMGEVIWTEEDTQEPFLLYDFNYQDGDTYYWPWSGMSLTIDNVIWPEDISEKEFNDNFNHEVEKGIKITQIEDQDYFGEIRKTYTLTQSVLDPNSFFSPGYGKIVEGIGIVSGEFNWYLSMYDLWYGYWIAPLSQGKAQTAAQISGPWTPALECVKEKDGRCIYGDENFDPLSVSMIHNGNSEPQMYNLQGMPIDQAEPGTIVIRNGRKYIVPTSGY